MIMKDLLSPQQGGSFSSCPMTTTMARHELSNDILLMNAALKGLTIGTPLSLPIKSNTHEILQAFITLLTITTPTDSSASNVVAATGTADADSIKVFYCG